MWDCQNKSSMVNWRKANKHKVAPKTTTRTFWNPLWRTLISTWNTGNISPGTNLPGEGRSRKVQSSVRAGEAGDSSVKPGKILSPGFYILSDLFSVAQNGLLFIYALTRIQQTETCLGHHQLWWTNKKKATVSSYTSPLVCLYCSYFGHLAVSRSMFLDILFHEFASN